MSREAAFNALFNLLTGLKPTLGVQVVDRRVKLIEDVDHADLPAIFMGAGKQHVEQSGIGNPGIRTLNVDLFVYAHNPDDSTPSSTILNNLIDAIEAALADDGFDTQTLGQTVAHCWIEGEIEIYDGKLSAQAVAIIPIKILLP